jgi:serine/threonine protein kinase
MSQPAWIGHTLSGRYQIESLLGQGGMSAVYRATDPNLKRTVAIKLIHPHLSTDTHFVQRFEEEAAAVASLRHPNIVQVYDFNVDQGVYYMVLEFIPGETLYDRLQRLSAQGRTLPLDQALQFALNICDALDYAHQRNIIHRDIKPANIMLNVSGQAILMDFGIVKLLGGTSHTATGAVLGTARYISPELIRSEPADQRSDIYSLGITLYEMLSGRAPFQSDSAMTLMMMHLNDPVPDPRTLRADLPAALVNLLLKALEKDRQFRYQTVAALAADLKRELAVIAGEAAGVPLPQAQAHPAPATVIAFPAADKHPGREALPPQPVSPPTNQPTFYASPRTSLTLPPESAPPSRQYTSSPAAGPARKINPALWLLGLGGGCLLFVFVLAAAGVLYTVRERAAALPATVLTATLVSAPGVVVQTPTPAAPPTALAATVAPPPSATPTPTVEPTATLPALYVRINGITLSGSQYVVEYETFGYTEKLPGMHVHFFFNSVPPKQAGMPGSGPWYVYGGPRPFKGYGVTQRPAGATQMCALVANSNHTVIAGSGNCVDLP